MAKLVAGTQQIDCKLLIFDKDGTIVEQKPVLLYLAKARHASLSHLVGAQVAEQWTEAVGINLRNEEIKNEGPLAMAPTREEALVTAFIIYKFKHESWDDAKQLAEKAYEEADKTMTPPYGASLIPRTLQTLQALKAQGFKIALATTDSHKRAQESLNKLKIGAFFDAVLGADDVEKGKPAPEMILKACRLTGCSPRDAAMVGDSYADMLMGKNAGVKACIGVLSGSTSRERLLKIADVVVPSVASLHVAK